MSSYDYVGPRGRTIGIKSSIITLLLICTGITRGDVDLHLLERQDFTSPPLDENILEAAKSIQIKEITDVEMFRSEQISLYYRETVPPPGVFHKADVLLLHGAAYSSSTWAQRVGQPNATTMQILAQYGYRTVAIDQPGSPRKTTGKLTRSRSSFMDDLIIKLNFTKPAIVSPSASGSFSLDFVSTYPQKVGAFIPVAPCCPHSTQYWSHITVPLLIVRGSGDGQPHKEFLSTKYHNVFIVPKAGHAAYLHQPALWHTSLVNFLNFVFSDRVTTPEPTEAPLAVADFGPSERDVNEIKNLRETELQSPVIGEAEQQQARSFGLRYDTTSISVGWITVMVHGIMLGAVALR